MAQRFFIYATVKVQAVLIFAFDRVDSINTI